MSHIDTQADHKQNQDSQRCRVEVHWLQGYHLGSSCGVREHHGSLAGLVLMVEDAQSQKVKLGSAIHLAFDELETVNLTFYLPIAPG